MAVWVDAFKSGKQKDSTGNEREWTDADLDKMVEKYNNQPKDQLHTAPVCIGHPTDNAPAFGWVASLKREGNTLKAELKDFQPEFVEWVKKGLYKTRSISLYNDMLLRHIGFLGAMPPAVKGLADPVFHDNDHSIVEFEFSTDVPSTQVFFEDNSDIVPPAVDDKIVTPPAPAPEPPADTNKITDTNFMENTMDPKILTDLLSWVTSTLGQEAGAQTASQIEVLKKKYLAGAAAKPADAKASDAKPAFPFTKHSDGDGEKPEPAKQTIQPSAEFMELQKRFEALEKQNKELEFNEYFKSKLGILTPGQKEITKAAFEVARAAKNPDGFAFAEGEGKITKLDGEGVIKKLIESFPKQLETEEVAKRVNFADNELAEQNKAIEEYNKNKKF